MHEEIDRFCCLCIGDHRDLHSFPTRRSSDLTDFTVKLVDVYPDGAAYNLDETIQRLRYRDGYEDRKSTRLNSSHQITSYAVFCLKKKRATDAPEEHHAASKALAIRLDAGGAR